LTSGGILRDMFDLCRRAGHTMPPREQKTELLMPGEFGTWRDRWRKWSRLFANV